MALDIAALRTEALARLNRSARFWKILFSRRACSPCPSATDRCRIMVGYLDDLHDDFVHTTRLWNGQLARQRYGAGTIVLNVKTGNLTSLESDWIATARSSLRRLRIRTFKDLAAQLELFVNRALHDWLTVFPHIVDEKSITLATILGSTDLAAARARAIEEAVNATVLKKMTGKPSGWFTYLKQNLGNQVTPAEVLQFAERKAA